MEYELRAYTIWECGQRRDSVGLPHQEDSIYPAHGHATERNRAFVLCDGMGGHDAGEVASSAVCQAMGEALDAGRSMHQAVSEAYAALDSYDTHSAHVMGTTMVALALRSDGAHVAHIGDSRLYHIRPGCSATGTHILFRTTDHSLVAELVRQGEMTEEEARCSPRRNIITRAMQPGAGRRPADEAFITDIRPGDFFYLCTDGMLEETDDRQLRNIFSFSTGSDTSCIAALAAATRHNRDNHSAIIVHVTAVRCHTWWPF